MTNSIQDVCEQAQVILLVGSNPEEAHPVMGMRLRQAVERGAKLIVVDPRDIGLAKKADIHLKLRPGTNVAFANGMVNVLIQKGLVDREFVESRTEGFDDLAAMVADYTPERVAEICDIDARDLIAAAELYAKASRAPIVYCLGVVEHSTGTEGVMALSNLALVSGKLGKPGCGINPLRGQNNVQGACDMGAGPADFTGYQKEDPVRTDPDTHHVIRALEALDFLVVEELFMTETAKYADVILPGRSYAEKEGTFTNTERRVQRVRKAVSGPAGPRLDTEVFADIMRRMGYDQPTLTGAQIMDEVASLTPSYAGISHARLDSAAVAGQGLQWPCTGPDHPGTRIMHEGKFARGLGSYSLAEYRPSAEQPDAEYPLIMMTGRVLAQYNAQAMTGRTEGLNRIDGSSFIEVNSADAAATGIVDGDRVRVSSRRGSIESTARVSGKTNPGQVWMPFHFQDGNANWLTNAALDNVSATPEYKVCAVRVEKA